MATRPKPDIVTPTYLGTCLLDVLQGRAYRFAVGSTAGAVLGEMCALSRRGASRLVFCASSSVEGVNRDLPLANSAVLLGQVLRDATLVQLNRIRHDHGAPALEGPPPMAWGRSITGKAVAIIDEPGKPRFSFYCLRRGSLIGSGALWEFLAPVVSR